MSLGHDYMGASDWDGWCFVARGAGTSGLALVACKEQGPVFIHIPGQGPPAIGALLRWFRPRLGCF